MQEYAVNAEHMVHCAMTEGMDINWPFGTSVLDPIFKTYKQKELVATLRKIEHATSLAAKQAPGSTTGHALI